MILVKLCLQWTMPFATYSGKSPNKKCPFGPGGTTFTSVFFLQNISVFANCIKIFYMFKNIIPNLSRSSKGKRVSSLKSSISERELTGDLNF